MINKISVFCNNIFIVENVSWLENLNKYCDSYVIKARENNKKYLINGKDFGTAHHSTSLSFDNNFKDFTNYVLEMSYKILNEQGYDLTGYFLSMRELWVQEFSTEGGGNHNTHTHWNGHMSGFYFLKCSLNTSKPVFHDPRPGKIMIQLPEKKITEITEASEKIHLNLKPGTFVFFNSYLPHEFPVDHGIDPFRFIHFNVQALPK